MSWLLQRLGLMRIVNHKMRMREEKAIMSEQIERMNNYITFLEELDLIMESKEQPQPPIDNCIHRDTDDGTCGNQKNTTPECHQWCCPEIRIVSRDQ